MSYFLYVIGTTQPDGNPGPSKIGISNNVAGRIERLKTGCPYKITQFFGFQMLSKENAFVFEREIHDDFKDSRLHGEWFDMDFDEALESVVTFIELAFHFNTNEGEDYSGSLALVGVNEANKYLRSQ